MRIPRGRACPRPCALLIPLLLPAVALAQEGRPPAAADSAALLLRQGWEARREELAPAVRRAIALWERARAVAARRSDRAGEAEALHRVGEAYTALSVYDSAAASLEAALEMRRAARDRVGEARTLVQLARVDGVRRDSARARGRLEQALALVGAAGTRGPLLDEAEAEARAARGRLLLVSGASDSALAEFRGALELRRRARDARGEADLLRMVGDAHAEAARPDSALAYYGRALALHEAAADPRGSAWTLRGAALAHGLAQRLDSALACARRALPLFRAVGERRGEAMTWLDAARVHHARGARDSVNAAVREAADLLAGVETPDEEDALATAAWAYHVAGKPDSVAIFTARSLERSRRAGNAYGEARALSELAVLRRQGGRPDSALVLLRQSLGVLRRADLQARGAGVLAEIGDVQLEMGATDSARAAYGQALETARASGDRRAEASSLSGLGSLWRHAGRYDSAGVAFEAAARVYREVGDRALEGYARMDGGSMLLASGRTDSARVLLADALRTAREAGYPAHETDALLLLGTLEVMAGRPGAALLARRAAVEAARRSGDPRRRASALADMALAMSDEWMMDSARVYAAGALEASQEIASPRIRANLLNGALAAIHVKLGRADSALALRRRALALYREAGYRPGEVRTLLGVGMLMGRRGEADSARSYMEQAVAAARESADVDGEGFALLALGNAIQGEHPDSARALLREAHRLGHSSGGAGLSAYAAFSLGDVHLAAGRSDSAAARYAEARTGARALSYWEVEAGAMARLGYVERARGNPAAALALYDSVAAALSRFGTRVREDDDRVAFQSSDAGMWGSWTLAWLARADAAGKRRARLAAFAIGERGRARALLELMRRPGAAERPPSIPAPGPDAAAEGAALLRRVRRGGTTLLLYQVAGDTLLRWMVPPSGLPLVDSAAIARDSLAALVRAARDALGADAAAARGIATRRAAPLEAPRGEAPFALPGALERLSRLLLPDALARALPPGAEIVVIPAEALNLVPFAALTLPDGEYLGARHPLRYAPSLSVLAEAERRPRARRDELSRALVVGDPAMPMVTTHTGEEVELDPLPGAAREAAWVAERLGARTLGGPAAGEKAVAALLAEAPLAHLATHGFAYASVERARDSFVALAPGEGEDGLLTVAEVLSELPALRAELVVLSACQTGLGSLRPAEGTVGLQRAFLGRGARSVLVSLWSVSDRATEALMRGFYTHWLEDADRPSKAEALRRAQADVRATPGFESPLFWAAFQLAGAR